MAAHAERDTMERKTVRLKNPLKGSYIVLDEKGNMLREKGKQTPSVYSDVKDAAEDAFRYKGEVLPADDYLHPVFHIGLEGEIVWTPGIKDYSPACSLAQARAEAVKELRQNLFFATRELSVQTKEFEKKRKRLADEVTKATRALRQFEIKYRRNLIKLNKGGKKDG
jgi:hypothetical protein